MGRLLDKTGTKPIIIAGASLCAVGLAGLGFIPQFWAFVASTVVVGLGISGLLGAPLRYMMITKAPAQFRGSAQGVLAVMIGLGQLFGGAAAGAIAAEEHSLGLAHAYREVFAAAAIVTVAGVVLASFMPNCHAMKD